MEQRVTIKPFISYYGGKYRAAPRYPEPRHDLIIEPFAGSAGYAMRYHWLDVMLIDANEIIAGIWDYLISAPSSEVLSLPLFTSSEQTIADLGPLCQEARWLIGMWCTHASDHPYTKPGKWLRDDIDAGRDTGKWGEKIRHRLASQQQYIRHWQIVHGPYTYAPDIDATWFVDPPYDNQAGRHYRCKFSDYEGLAKWCRERPGQVMVCENSGATWLPFRGLYHMAGRVGAGQPQNKTIEAIWTND